MLHDPPSLPLPQVLEAAWPILSGVAQAPVCQAAPLVVEALCEVYQRSMMAAKLAARPLLPTLITSVMTLYKVRRRSVRGQPPPHCCPPSSPPSSASTR